MLCEFIKVSGEARGPFPYQRDKMMRLLLRWGMRINALPGTLNRPLEMDGGTLYPVTVIRPQAGRNEDVWLDSRVVSEAGITYTYLSAVRNVTALRKQMKERISAHHALYELGYVDVQNVAIKADLEARINAAEIKESFKNGKIKSAKWRGKNGKIPVDTVEQMEEIYDSIFRYLEYGFIAKELAEDAVDAEPDATLHGLDPIAIFNNTIDSLQGV